LDSNREFTYTDINKKLKTIQLGAGTMSFTYCQTLIIYKLDTNNGIQVIYNDGSVQEFNNLKLDLEVSKKVFKRTGDINRIIVSLHR
jgi:hypothetical protein